MRLLLTIFILANSAMADTGVFRFVKGEVFVGEKVAVKGQSFNIDDKISTRAQSLAILSLKDGSTLKLNENTTVAVNTLTTPTAPTTVTMSTGSMITNVLKEKLRDLTKPKFILKTKLVAMGVRGTTFFASFGKNGSEDVWMCVNEGVVGVKSANEKAAKFVNAGEGVKVENGQKTSKPKPLPWTKKINWNLDSDNADELTNKINIEDAYSNPLDFYYE